MYRAGYGLAKRGASAIYRYAQRHKGTAKKLGYAAAEGLALGAGVGAMTRGGTPPTVGRKRPRSRGRRGQNASGMEILPAIVKKKGRKPRKLNITMKLARIGVLSRTLRWQAVNALNRATGGACPGSVILDNRVSGTSTVVPLHVFCLNSTDNYLSAQSQPWRRLIVNDDGSLNFSSTGMLTRQEGTAGAATLEWQVENSTTTTGVGSTSRYILNEYYDIKFNCYGANAQPTKYEIMVCRFKEGYLDPLELPSSPQEADDRKALWQGLARECMYNPILPGEVGRYMRRKFKVLHRTSFTIQPSRADDVDTNPSSRVVKIFYRDGRVYDYQYHGEPFTGVAADENLNTDKFIREPNEASDFVEFPAPRARLWLVVRALNTTVTGDGATSTAANAPSYDFIVRKREHMPAV